MVKIRFIGMAEGIESHNIQTFKGQKLIIDAPYNKHINKKIPRFSTWDDIYFWFLNNESWYIKLCRYLIKKGLIK